MIADIVPNILITIDVRQSILAHVVTAVFVDVVELRTRRDGVVLPWWESPGAPLLGVFCLKRVGDE